LFTRISILASQLVARVLPLRDQPYLNYPVECGYVHVMFVSVGYLRTYVRTYVVYTCTYNIFSKNDEKHKHSGTMVPLLRYVSRTYTCTYTCTNNVRCVLPCIRSFSRLAAVHPPKTHVHGMCAFPIRVVVTQHYTSYHEWYATPRRKLVSTILWAKASRLMNYLVWFLRFCCCSCFPMVTWYFSRLAAVYPLVLPKHMCALFQSESCDVNTL
jgi:hypothetical protein